jgi:hypothetical protein
MEICEGKRELKSGSATRSNFRLGKSEGTFSWHKNWLCVACLFRLVCWGYLFQSFALASIQRPTHAKRKKQQHRNHEVLCRFRARFGCRRTCITCSCKKNDDFWGMRRSAALTMERFAGQPEPIGHGGTSGGRYSHDAIVYRVPLCGFHGRMHMRKLIFGGKKGCYL